MAHIFIFILKKVAILNRLLSSHFGIITRFLDYLALSEFEPSLVCLVGQNIKQISLGPPCQETIRLKLIGGEFYLQGKPKGVVAIMPCPAYWCFLTLTSNNPCLVRVSNHRYAAAVRGNYALGLL